MVAKKATVILASPPGLMSENFLAQKLALTPRMREAIGTHVAFARQ
jgi:hypothetical protein